MPEIQRRGNVVLRALCVLLRSPPVRPATACPRETTAESLRSKPGMCWPETFANPHPRAGVVLIATFLLWKDCRF